MTKLDNTDWSPLVQDSVDLNSLSDVDSVDDIEIDFVIVVAVGIELRAVLQVLQPLNNKSTICVFDSNHRTFYLGIIGDYKCAVVMCSMGTAGRDGSILTATEALQTFQPKAGVVMPGIAFGRDEHKQTLGDVVVGSVIINYENVRKGSTHDINRAYKVEPSQKFINHLKQIEALRSWSGKNEAKLVIKPMLSGEKLVDDPDFKAELFNAHPEASAGEMEGYGIYSAAQNFGVEWIVIKGICDWGDGQKTKEAQPLAAYNSVSVVEMLLKRRGLSGDKGTAVQKAQITSSINAASLLAELQNKLEETTSTDDKTLFELGKRSYTICLDKRATNVCSLIQRLFFWSEELGLNKMCPEGKMPGSRHSHFIAGILTAILTKSNNEAQFDFFEELLKAPNSILASTLCTNSSELVLQIFNLASAKNRHQLENKSLSILEVKSDYATQNSIAHLIHVIYDKFTPESGTRLARCLAHICKDGWYKSNEDFPRIKLLRHYQFRLDKFKVEIRNGMRADAADYFSIRDTKTADGLSYELESRGWKKLLGFSLFDELCNEIISGFDGELDLGLA